MKTILIATDFSSSACNAAAYGVEMAKAFNATAILFNVCEQFPGEIGDEQTAHTREEVKEDIMEKLAEDARLLKTLHDFPVHFNCKTGNTLHAFREAILETSADLVITGMKKDRKGIQRVLGSTVALLIGQLEIPLLVVPEEIKFTYLLNIALAMSWDTLPTQNNPAVNTIRELTERFHSKLYFVQVTQSLATGNSHPLNFPYQLTWVKENMNTEFERVTGENIPDSLSEFVQFYNINILMILAHKQSLFKRLLFRSNSRTLAFECPVPLLILPGESTIPDLTTDAGDHQLQNKKQ